MFLSPILGHPRFFLRVGHMVLKLLVDPASDLLEDLFG